MVSVIWPPIGTVVAGVNTRTDITEAPTAPPEVMEVKMIPTSAGTEVPGLLTPSTDVETVRPLALTPIPAPVVSSPAIKVILVTPTGTA